MNEHLILLSEAEYALRLGRLQQAMEPAADALLLCDNANLYWLTGRVFAGYAYIPREGAPLFGLRRCVHLTAPGAVAERKIEDFAARVAAECPAAARIGYEMVVRGSRRTCTATPPWSVPALPLPRSGPMPKP